MSDTTIGALICGLIIGLLLRFGGSTPKRRRGKTYKPPKKKRYRRVP